MKYNSTCGACDHKVTAYSHRLNAPLVEGLIKLWRAEKEKGHGLRMGEIGLDNSQYSNFAHLAYWGLTECWEGRWFTTEKAKLFLAGATPLPDCVAVMAREVLPDNHPAWETHGSRPKMVYLKDVYKGEWEYKQAGAYKEEKSDQEQLF